MATLRFKFDGDSMGRAFHAKMAGKATRVNRAVATAAKEAKQIILAEGAADIKRGGNFGERWIKSLTVDIEKTGAKKNKVTLHVYHKIPYADVFEFGATIFGRPLLWIPLSWTGIKTRARDWGRSHGGLFRVDRKGLNPLLLSIRDRQPKYVGVRSVRLRKRFHLRAIIRRVSRRMGTLYRKAYRNG